MKRLTREEEITRQTYDALAEQWVAGHTSSDFYTKELQEFQKLLPQGSILEIGSGGGRDAKALIAVGYDYVGTDVSEGLIKTARRSNPGVKFQKVSVYDLNFPKSFDGFWCAAMLIHVPKNRISEALQAIRCNMKKGAAGFITMKEGKGESLEKKIDLDGDGRFFAYWQNDEFKKVLNENGFKVVQEGYLPHSNRSKWLVYFVRVK